MIPRKYSRMSFFLFFAIAIAFSLYIIRPLLSVIVGGFLLAYIFYPLHDYLLQKTGRKTLSAFIMTIMVFLVILVPFVIFVGTVSKDVSSFYRVAKQHVSGGYFFQGDCTDGLPCKIDKLVGESISDQRTKIFINNTLSNAMDFMLKATSSFLISLPKVIINFFILFFMLFYSFRDGRKLLVYVMALLPLKDQFKDDLKSQTKEVLYATVYGNIVVAIVQGLVGTIGFVIFGVESPLLWGFLMIFAALLPFIGSALVWLPASLLLVVAGYIEGDATAVWKGIGLMLYGLLFISTIDNILKPKIIGRKTSLHPALIIIGLFGGLATLGFLGIILGPIILAMLVSFIKVYKKDREGIFDHGQ